MDAAQIQRILRQNQRTDRLLGIEAVPAYMVQLPEMQTPEPVATPAAPKPSAPSAQPQQSRMTVSLDTIPSQMDVATKQNFLQQIDETEVRDCKACQLCDSRTQTVFGMGNPNADIMFIGEGPGQEEDRQGLPFVGRSGELLDKQIAAMGQYAGWDEFDRQQVYIANVVKCRPPNNRAPTPIEADTCWTYLQRQIAIVEPKVIITLGGPAAKRILNTEEGITRLRGRWHEFHGSRGTIPVMPTFHPAYILRTYTKENRAKVWSDLQAAVDRVRNG